MKRGGVIVFLFLIAVVGLGMLSLALLLRGTGSEDSANPMSSASVLVFDVPFVLEEADPPPGSLGLDWLRPDRPTLWRVVNALRHAAEDKKIESLVLHISDVDWGWAKIAEVRDAIQVFRDAGKPVYASLTGGGEREYMLASVADFISAPPLGFLQLDGLTASALFMKGTFDKLDITPNFAHSGTYKSGVEGFTRNEMSEPAREALQSLLDDLYGTMLDTLAVARGMSSDSVGSLLDQGPYDSESAWVRGLVDTVLYEADLDSMVTVLADDASTVTLSRYMNRVQLGTGPRVALVVASGAIYEGRSRESPTDGVVLGSETIIKALRQARRRSSIKAIVLRIDSPGGAAPPSDEIWREVERCREEKPVVASMSDYAASGGYYIAVAADSIVAQPSTITGSIGVYGGKLNILGLYRKLGLNVESVARGAHAGMMSPYRDFSPEEAARFQDGINVIYRAFTSRVVNGRGLDSAAVEASAQGRVWSGRAALERGLVDELGGVPRAIEVAKAMAKIEPDQQVVIDVYPKIERTFLQRMFAGMVSEDPEAWARLRLPVVIRAWMAAASFPAGMPLTLMPYSIEVR